MKIMTAEEWRDRQYRDNCAEISGVTFLGEIQMYGDYVKEAYERDLKFWREVAENRAKKHSEALAELRYIKENIEIKPKTYTWEEVCLWDTYSQTIRDIQD